MALADRLEIVSEQRKRKTGCAYRNMFEALSKEDQKALDNAWAKGYSINVIIRSLRSEGIKTSNESITTHRKGLCDCPKN